MSLLPPERARKLQTASHVKAKSSPDYRSSTASSVGWANWRKKPCVGAPVVMPQHKFLGRGYSRYPSEHLHDRLGLVRLEE